MKLCSILALTSVVAGMAVSARAQDWPQWRGPNRDARAAGFRSPATWPAELKEKWKVAVGDGVATPALVGDKLYVFTRQEGYEVLRCLNAADGKELWQDKYEAQGATGPSQGFSGPRSSPAVADGKVVTYGVRGTLSCTDAATGKNLWRKEDSAAKPPRFFTSCSPLIADGRCIIQIGGEDGGAIAAYALATGDELWRWAGDGSAYASPAAMRVGDAKTLVTLTARKIVGVGLADGKLLWELPFVAQGRAYNAATPIVEGATVIISGAGRGTRAFSVARDGDSFAAKELWANPDMAVQFDTPVLKDQLLYGITQNGDLFCLDARDGKTLWTTKLGGRGFGSVVDAGSALLALTPQGEMVVFEPTGKEFKKLAGYKVGTDTYAYPIPASGGIYIKDKDSLALLSFAP
ncbi:MAG TPA: PQQ-binding-like beta-propeller repeat protein [Candidatus Paceibacterota bacterium]|nr:PQQ-binding-like beta-propeller repeat protein [Candidatus Paceibacterota bacterium]HRT57315.1 PQQ-binding-like beta-propeller repeat protein [Candidatus Paceibacterota bacterium]